MGIIVILSGLMINLLSTSIYNAAKTAYEKRKGDPLDSLMHKCLEKAFRQTRIELQKRLIFIKCDEKDLDMLIYISGGIQIDVDKTSELHSPEDIVNILVTKMGQSLAAKGSSIDQRVVKIYCELLIHRVLRDFQFELFFNEPAFREMVLQELQAAGNSLDSIDFIMKGILEAMERFHSFENWLRQDVDEIRAKLDDMV